jgi:flagellar M-ring protein FliF
MEWLNRVWIQVRDLFLSMTPAARATTVVLVGVIGVSLGYLFTSHTGSTDSYLMGGQSFGPAELKAMEAAFGKAGLSTYQIEGTRIRIPKGQEAKYMAALVEHNALPPDFGEFLSKAVETSSPFLTAKQLESRKIAAKERELALIIRSLPGIEKAAVLFDAQTEGGLRAGTVKTASVAVKALGSQPLDPEQVRKIRHLVAAAFAGMRPEHVTVADLNGQTYAGSGDPASGSSASDDPYIARKREHEKDWQLKILKALAYVPGVTVTTNVELDRQQIHRTEDIKHDPKPVPIRVSESESSRTREGGGPGGRPGYVAQQPKANSPTSVSGRTSISEQEEQSKSETLNAVSTQRSIVEQIGLTPKRVTAAIGVPTSYFLRIWEERNPAGPGQTPKQPDANELKKIRDEEIKKIREHVAALLPPADGVADKTELVTVTEFQDIPGPEIPTPGWLDRIWEFLATSWSTLALVALAAMSLWVIRSVSRASLPTTPSVAKLPGLPAAEPEEEDTQKKSRLARFAAGGPSLKDELAEMVREDPEAAANILRAWIGTPQ